MKTSTLGSYIRSLRERNHMTQLQLAERLNVTDKAVSKWERDLSFPDIALFPKLAAALGVDVSDLINECVDEGQPSRLVRIFEMSQDIRTPLHIILGCADMAANHYEDKELVMRYLQSIRISGEHLLNSIDYVAKVLKQMNDGTESSSFDHMGKLEKDLCELPMLSGKSAGAYDFSGKRILVAEDMQINREIAGEILKKTHADIEFAVDGLDCIEKVAAQPADHYDLILMDIMMPNMGGIEATKHIRALDDSRKASIPIIAVSANVLDMDRSAALEAGMNAFAEKPVNIDKLFKTMGRCLSGELS